MCIRDRIQTITVVGAGTMGNGIAHIFAQYGFAVKLVDVSQSQLDNALVTIKKNLERQLTKKLITEDQKLSALQNITTLTSLSESVRQADLVIEAATEHV